MQKSHYSYLALGDSYTIGESVPLQDSFPYQLVQLLRKAGLGFYAPEMIAQTGWTSFELAEQLLKTRLNGPYDFVTLLIGVNNQYRGLPFEDFMSDIDFLLNKAIHLSGEKPRHVIVVSIPDWGVTPFAKNDLRTTISKEIDHFNEIGASAAKMKGAHFIDITEESRKVVDDNSLLARDQLHYSGKAHLFWATKIAEMILQEIG